jgi:hypothetical protein
VRSDFFDRLFSVQPEPDRLELVVLGAALLALVFIGYHPTWRWSRSVITIAHEGGHAVVALLCGRRLTGIRLHSDTSGLTVSSGRPTGLGMILTLLAGYPAAPIVGLIGAVMVTAGRITLMLAFALVMLPLMLVMIRNVFGVLSVVTAWGVVFAVALYASDLWQWVFAYSLVWFLLIGGVRPVFELQRQRSRGRMPNSDADQIGRLTRMPPLAWVGVFLAVALVALVAGGWLLARWLLPGVEAV